MNKILSIKNLRIKYKNKTIIDGLAFDALKGETVSLIWKSWVWKSSILKAILWSIKYDWNIELNSKNISYIPQKLDFDRTIPITSFEFIKLYNKNIKKESCEEILKSLAWENLLDKKIWNLSWWELQKILITNSLVKNPDLILMDEPTAWIDTIWEDFFYSLISKVKSKFPELTIIIISHNINIIYKNSDKILFLHEKCYCFWKPEEISMQWNITNFSDKEITPFIHKHNHNHN